MSYNVHRCIGADGKCLPARIAAVIARYDPHVVALQELDIGHARTDHADQPDVIAKAVGMDYLFFPALEAADQRYGDAILTRCSFEVVRVGLLPSFPHRTGVELRGALWIRVVHQGRRIQVLNTHLDYHRLECLAQVNALVGPEWLGHPECTPPRLCCGDFNAWPGTRAYQRLRSVLHDAQERGRHTWRRNTFPARCPMLCIDHVFHSPDLILLHVGVPRTRLTRVASDHLPVIAEFSLPKTNLP